MSNGRRRRGARCWLISPTAMSMTVSVLRPRKSNLTSPAFSTSFLAYWVTISPFWPRKHGTWSHSGSLGDHHAGGVHAGVAVEALERRRDVEQLAVHRALGW